ncbi:MAG TPA: 23S rRNA (guanosine(2251)-2'-O)-methyltransferase RlmB, partial [Acidimicrobiaceae bacterium]|nr:23S rRNA (guanosine(2251)-2'-O)-methyltransferase RlmB [Acidimicrobiaceae bacterium]
PGQKGGSRPPIRAKRAPDRGLGGTQVEGRHAVRELLLAGQRRVSEVLISAEMDQADIIDDIVELARDLKVPIREIPRRRFDSEAKTESSQGVLARAAELKEKTLFELCSTAPSAGQAPFLLAVDGVTDPGNLGALIRTAECAGVTGLVLPRHRAVHVTPTVTKTAAGAVEHVPMALVGGLPSAIEAMKAEGVWVVGLDAGGEQSLHDMTLGAEPVCFVLGAEGAGLSRLVRQRCDAVVSIPLRGALSSLNVATAGALAIYEVVRRRSMHP